MLSGRHLLFLGVLAGAGLISVRDSQSQVTLGYEIAKVENQLRKEREEIETERARLRAMQSPGRVIERAKELKLEVVPASALALYTPMPDSNTARPNTLPQP